MKEKTPTQAQLEMEEIHHTWTTFCLGCPWTLLPVEPGIIEEYSLEVQ